MYLLHQTLLLLIIFSPFSFSQSHKRGTFALLSDLHYAPELGSTPPSPSDVKFGFDSPFWLINSTAYSIAQAVLERNVSLDFILSAGDLTSHSLAYKNKTDAINYFDQVLSGLSRIFLNAFGKSNKYLTSPVSVLGNNDLYPKYAAPHITPDWFIRFAEGWASLGYDDGSAKSDFLDSGCFALDIPTTKKYVRVIGLHTNYWSVFSLNTTTMEDPAGIFEWLKKQLDNAKSNGVKVYILGHAAPVIDHVTNKPQWQSRFVNRYYEIISPFLEGTVMAQFFGHEHAALFHMMAKKTSGVMKDTSGAAPIQLHSSISPVYNNAPCFRLYEYDRETMELLDFSSWYMDLNAKAPTWRLQFASAKDLFGLEHLNEGSVCKLVQHMYDNSTLMNLYLNNSVSFTNAIPFCDDDTCKSEHLCGTQYITDSDYLDCVRDDRKPSCDWSGGPSPRDRYLMKWITGSVILGVVVLSLLGVAVYIFMKWRRQRLQRGDISIAKYHLLN